MSLSRRNSSRIISAALLATLASLLLLTISYSSEAPLHWLFGLDSKQQAVFRDICALVAIAALVLAAMINQADKHASKQANTPANRLDHQQSEEPGNRRGGRRTRK
ncbi:MAG: hypothetical protein V4488_12720 [Pseudomonadota bacterium]